MPVANARNEPGPESFVVVTTVGKEATHAGLLTRVPLGAEGSGQRGKYPQQNKKMVF
jgi:hypothetical protein